MGSEAEWRAYVGLCGRVGGEERRGQGELGERHTGNARCTRDLACTIRCSGARNMHGLAYAIAHITRHQWLDRDMTTLLSHADMRHTRGSHFQRRSQAGKVQQ